MNREMLIEEIAKKDFDLDGFVQLTIDCDEAREELVKQMTMNPHIMVYYHCYYVIAKASQVQPDLFYPYWDAIAALVKHENSYHRDFGITIIGDLTEVDRENRFSELEEDYFAVIHDEKFMTGNCCVQNLRKIYRHKRELRGKIIALLLDIDQQCPYSEKQKGLLKHDVLDIFDEFYEDLQEKDPVNQFIRTQLESVSPKTRKKAKALVRKYSL